jgi:hypothetical protein
MWSLPLASLIWPSSCWASITLSCLIGSLLLMLHPCSTGDVRQWCHMRLDRVIPFIKSAPGYLVDFWCEDTRHSGRLFSGLLVRGHLPRGEPGPQVWSGLDLPMELGVWPAFCLPFGRACSRWGVCPTSDPTSFLGRTRAELHRHGTKGTLVPKYW